MNARGPEPSRRWRLVRASPDAIPPSVRRFMQRARRRRLRAAVPWGIALGAVLVLASLSWLVFASPVLGVDQVKVVGAHIVTPDQVRQAAQVRAGTPLASVDTAGVRERVSALAPVRRVTVSRSWPSTLVITITERVAVAAVPRDKQFELMDGQGVVFRTVAHPPAGVMVVKLADPGPADPSTQAALRVLAALPAELRQQVARLVVDAPARIRLELTDNRVVVWGDAEQSDVKAKVAIALLAQPGHRFDVSAPDVVTIS